MTALTKTETTTPKQTTSAGPLALRLRGWGPLTAEAHIRNGKVSAQLAFMALQDDEGYYRGLVSEDYAIKAYATCAVDMGLQRREDHEQAAVMRIFAKEVRDERWSQYTLDKGFVCWRRSGERFMPTAGQMRKCLLDAKVPFGPSVYSDMFESIGKLSGAAKKPDNGPVTMTRDELVMAIARKKADKARGYAINRTTEKRRPWIEHVDGPVLAGLERKLEAAA